MIEVLRNRRSVRRFEDRPVEGEKLDLLKEALVRSPTSRSINPWEFIVVDDREIIQALSLSKKHGSGFLKTAPLAVVIVGNTEASDTCVEDCSIAAITLQYAAESLDLKSCWCQIRLRDHGDGKNAEEYVRKTLGIPEHYLVECIIGMGYPGEGKEPHAYDSLDWGKVYYNKFEGN